MKKVGVGCYVSRKLPRHTNLPRRFGDRSGTKVVEDGALTDRRVVKPD